MPCFLFLVPPPCAPGALSEWVAREAIRGVVRLGARCAGGMRVRREGGVTTVADPEPRWGFLVVEAEDDRAALALAGACPGGGTAALDIYRLDLDDTVGEVSADTATLR